MFEYQARVDESRYPQGAYDGDTVNLFVDLGFGIVKSMTVRLTGVNTPELRGAEKEQGKVFRDFTRAWLAESATSGGKWPLLIKTQKDKSGKYGRYLAEIFRLNDPEKSLNQYLLDLGSPVYE